MKLILMVKPAIVIAITATAQNVKYYTSNGIAINGYDPVAFFYRVRL